MQFNDDHKCYQKSVLDIDVRINTPSSHYIAADARQIRRRQKTSNILGGGDRVYIHRHISAIRRSQISINLEAYIEEREKEVYQFKTNNQNAILSPLLTQALVTRTERYLDIIEQRALDPAGDDAQPFQRFWKYARIVRTLCLICRQ